MPNHQLATTEKGSQTIFLNSDDAEFSISDAEKFFYLNQSIIAPPGYRLLMGLNNLTIPNTMYNINSTNNTITIDDTTFTLEVGNYTGSSLATALNDLTGFSDLGVISFSSSNNLFSLGSGTTSRTLKDSILASKIMGFTDLPKDSTTTTIAGVDVNFIYGTNTCNLAGVTNIYVRVRNLSFNNLDSRGRITNVCGNVVNNTNFGGFVFYQPPEVLYYLINENIINHLDIELTDQEGNVLELNGASFNMTFTIHYTHQRQSLFKNSLLDEIREKNKTKEEKKSS
jgi:hypothetical protein